MNNVSTDTNHQSSGDANRRCPGTTGGAGTPQIGPPPAVCRVRLAFSRGRPRTTPTTNGNQPAWTATKLRNWDAAAPRTPTTPVVCPRVAWGVQFRLLPPWGRDSHNFEDTEKMRNKQSGCPRRRERAHGAGEGETETPVEEVVWRVGAEPGCFLGGRGLGNGSLVTSSVTSERKMSTRRGEAELEHGEEGRKRRNARGGRVGTRKTRGNGQRPVENFSQSGEQVSNAKPGRAVVR